MQKGTFIFIGRSGCGKGTQADLLVEYLKAQSGKDSVFRLETGKVFRDFISKKGYANGIAEGLYEKGELMPEFLSIWVWAEYCIENLKPDQHMIFDGSPRRLPEAHAVDSAISFFNRDDVHVVYLNVSEESAMKRLLARKRLDDNTDDIKARMAWFAKDVLPTIAFYKNNPRYNFHEIDGEKTPEEIHSAIMKALALPVAR